MKNFFARCLALLKEDAPWALLLAFAFLSMVSTPMARIALAASLACTLFDSRSRRRLRVTSPAFGWLAYLALAIVVSSIAAATISDPLLVPRKGLGKLTKLLWFAAIPLCAAHVNSAHRFRRVLEALAAGGLVLSVIVLLWDTSFAWLQVNYPPPGGAAGAPALAAALQRAATALGLDSAMQRWLTAPVWDLWGGRPPCFLYALTFNATLHDAQRLMVAMLAATALAAPVPRSPFPVPRSAPLTSDGGAVPPQRGPGAAEAPATAAAGGPSAALAAALTAAALVVTCKRAPLAAGILSLALLLALLSRPWKAIAAALAICLLAVAVPQSRARLQMMPAEFRLKSGGRALMWTRIAPELHRQHPWGIGFRSLTPAKMESIDKRVEPNRTHLHSSPLEAFIDFGWLGLAAWLMWMTLAFRAAARTAMGRGAMPGALPRPLRLLPLAALASLVMVALVEYNIGDAAVVLLYGTILGISEFKVQSSEL